MRSDDVTSSSGATEKVWDGTTPGALDWDKLDRETITRWRREAITTSAMDRLWVNRCEALCNALLHAQARLAEGTGARV